MALPIVTAKTADDRMAMLIKKALLFSNARAIGRMVLWPEAFMR